MGCFIASLIGALLMFVLIAGGLYGFFYLFGEVVDKADAIETEHY